MNYVPVGIGKGSMQLKTRAAGTMGDCPSTFLSPIMLGYSEMKACSYAS